MPWLTIAICAPLLGAVLCLALPARPSRMPFAVALMGAVASAVALLITAIRFDPDQGMQLVEEATWIPSLDVAWRVGVDGMALVLALLTAVLFIAAIAWSSYHTNTLTRPIADKPPQRFVTMGIVGIVHQGMITYQIE